MPRTGCQSAGLWERQSRRDVSAEARVGCARRCRQGPPVMLSVLLLVVLFLAGRRQVINSLGGEWILQRRMTEARLLLGETETAIGVVAAHRLDVRPGQFFRWRFATKPTNAVPCSSPAAWASPRCARYSRPSPPPTSPWSTGPAAKPTSYCPRSST